jgi:hypothetical protein
MQLNTKFSINDSVFDRIGSEIVKIVGVEVKHGKLNSSGPEYHCCAEYYIQGKSALPSFRAESEIEPLKIEDRFVNEYIEFEKKIRNGSSKS